MLNPGSGSDTAADPVYRHPGSAHEVVVSRVNAADEALHRFTSDAEECGWAYALTGEKRRHGRPA
jgi:hypothetical protein